MVGIQNPRATTNKAAIDGGLEANTMAILDSYGLKNSRDLHDDKLSFLEAVRAASLVSDSPAAPSWKMCDAIFQILRGSGSLELAMSSYQLLTDVDKHYPRVYLKRLDDLTSKPESTSSGPRELVVAKEAWLPFSVCPETAEGGGKSRNSLHADSLATSFCTMIEEICQYANRRNSQLVIKSAENMLLFQYLVSVIETDFLPRHTLYKETLNWLLLRESLLSMFLGSRRLNFKSTVKDCMSIMYKRCHQHNDISLRDLKHTTNVSGSAKTSHDCDIALAFAATQLERQTYAAVQRFLTLIMELDVIKKEADLHGLTSRADGLRTPLLDIILDELTYVKDHISPFLKVFSEPRWKLEIILQFFSKYCPKTYIHTRRSNDSPKEANFENMLNYFASAVSTKAIARKIALEDAQLLLAHAFQAYLSLLHNQKHIVNNIEKAGSSTLSHICRGLISAFQNIRKIDENLEITPYEKEALFIATTIVSQKY